MHLDGVDLSLSLAFCRKLRLGHCVQLDDSSLRLLAAYRRGPPVQPPHNAARHLSGSSASEELLQQLTAEPSSQLLSEGQSLDQNMLSGGVMGSSSEQQSGHEAGTPVGSSADQLLRSLQGSERAEAVDEDLDSLPGDFYTSRQVDWTALWQVVPDAPAFGPQPKVT